MRKLAEIALIFKSFTIKIILYSKSMQSQASKIALAIISTAIVVGGSIYFWQKEPSVTTSEQSQQIIKEEPTTLPKDTSEYHSFSGIKFRFPVNRGANQGYDLVTVQEDQEGSIMLCSKTQPDLCQDVSLYRKSPNADIEDAIKAVYKTSEEQGCRVFAQKIESSPTGLLRFKVFGETAPGVPAVELPTICSGGRVVAYYNPGRADRFVIIGVAQDTILELSIIEDSLEIK